MESTAGQSKIGSTGHTESVQELSGKYGIWNQRWYTGYTLWYCPCCLTVPGCWQMAVIWVAVWKERRQTLKYQVNYLACWNMRWICFCDEFTFVSKCCPEPLTWKEWSDTEEKMWLHELFIVFKEAYDLIFGIYIFQHMYDHQAIVCLLCLLSALMFYT
jgi:hypothetical protein